MPHSNQQGQLDQLTAADDQTAMEEQSTYSDTDEVLHISAARENAQCMVQCYPGAAEIGEFRISAASSTTSVVEDAAGTRNSPISQAIAAELSMKGLMGQNCVNHSVDHDVVTFDKSLNSKHHGQTMKFGERNVQEQDERENKNPVRMKIKLGRSSYEIVKLPSDTENVEEDASNDRKSADSSDNSSDNDSNSDGSEEEDDEALVSGDGISFKTKQCSDEVDGEVETMVTDCDDVFAALTVPVLTPNKHVENLFAAVSEFTQGVDSDPDLEAAIGYSVKTEPPESQVSALLPAHKYNTRRRPTTTENKGTRAKNARLHHTNAASRRSSLVQTTVDFTKKSNPQLRGTTRHLGPSVKYDKRFACGTCGKRYTSQRQLLLHLESHAGRKAHACPVCGKTFVFANSVPKHMLLHSGGKPHVCDICGQGFTQSGNLYTHRRKHTGEKPHVCTICGKAYRNGSSLISHVEMHNRPPRKPVNCPVCGKDLVYKRFLNSHLTKEHDFKLYKCDQCDKSFREGARLRIHQRTHTNERAYECGVCQKAFASSSGLTRHMHIHTGAKRFHCPVCDQAFTQEGNMQRHLKTHTGDKPYQCSICPKQFTEPGNLTRHIKIHTGERAFMCTVCKMCFALSDTLKRHMRTHTGEKPYRCSMCGQRFADSSTFAAHRRKVHREMNCEEVTLSSSEPDVEETSSLAAVIKEPDS